METLELHPHSSCRAFPMSKPHCPFTVASGNSSMERTVVVPSAISVSSGRKARAGDRWTGGGRLETAGPRPSRASVAAILGLPPTTVPQPG